MKFLCLSKVEFKIKKFNRKLVNIKQTIGVLAEPLNISIMVFRIYLYM